MHGLCTDKSTEFDDNQHLIIVISQLGLRS